MNVANMIAAASLAAVGTGLWGFFRLRERWRNRLAAQYATMCFRHPPRLRLQRVAPFKWTNPARAKARATALRALGFEPLGGFRVAEGGARRMLVLRQPEWSLVALVQDEDSVGTWSDVAWFDSGRQSAIYASSALKRKHFYLAAGGPDIYLPAESEVKVVEAVRKAAGNGGRRYELSTDAVIAAIEDAYAESADAYLLRPIEEAELRRELKSSAGDDETELDEQLLGRVQAQLPRVVADKLREACRAQFVRETKLSAREWQAARGRLLVLHDRTPLTELAARKIRGLPHANAAYRTAAIRKRLKQSKPANLSPRAKFAELNQTLPSWERYTKLGEVSRPIPADIYCAPVERPTT